MVTKINTSQIKYVSAGAGAVETTVQSKLRELISVGDHGDTDGIGTITLNVPSQFATIQAAFNWLRSRTIAAGTTVVIQVADGTHDYTGAAVNLNHPQGSQIRLVGNETTPTNCVLTWTNTSSGIDGLLVSNGNTLGYINGFHITRTAHAGEANTVGLLAEGGATIICGPNMRVSNHYYGIAARYGSYIKANSAVVDGAGDVGIWAFTGPLLIVLRRLSLARRPLQPLGFGIQAEYGSVVNCAAASTSGNKVAGIAALSGSVVRCPGATSNSNTGSGLLARDGGVVEAHGATTNSNTRYGIEEITNGAVYYATITQSGNTLGSRAPVAAMNDLADLGARVRSASGALRVDTSGADPVYFHTGGGLQFEIAHVAAAVNRARVRGSASGGTVIFDANGSNPNIDVAVAGQGAGSVFLGSQQANFVRANGAGPGGVPAIFAEGANADIDLLLAGKGAGAIRWGKHSVGSVTANGYVEWRLADGATVRVAAQML